MVRYILLLLVLLAICVYIYLRVERSKMRAIVDERERLAHEMHDTLAQSFAGVGFHLQGVRNSLRSGSLAIPAVLEKLDVACAMVTHTHREASAEIAALHPNADDGCDVLTALERGTHAMLEEMPSLKLVREGTPRELSLTARDVLFQIGRESIANVLRHSRATEIVLKLRYEAREVSLDVCDNGIGFVLAEHEGDFGIRAMRRRSQKAATTFQIDTAPGKGTCVRVKVPCGHRFRLSTWMRSSVRNRVRKVFVNPARGGPDPDESLRQ
jgi:signal transduction histidine kinase